MFGQATHKVAALRWDQIDRDGTCTITLGTHPITLESPLDQLVVEVAESTTNRQTAAHSASEWVFPGNQPGNHLGESHLRLRLKSLGFPSLATCLATWQTITQTAPPPVLADALGIHPQTAIQHALRGYEKSWQSWTHPHYLRTCAAREQSNSTAISYGTDRSITSAKPTRTPQPSPA